MVHKITTCLYSKSLKFVVDCVHRSTVLNALRYRLKKKEKKRKKEWRVPGLSTEKKDIWDSPRRAMMEGREWFGYHACYDQYDKGGRVWSFVRLTTDRSSTYVCMSHTYMRKEDRFENHGCIDAKKMGPGFGEKKKVIR